MKQLPLWKRPYLARRILDIGAGHNAFKGATHVLDFDLTEGHDRGGRRKIMRAHGHALVVAALRVEAAAVG